VEHVPETGGNEDHSAAYGHPGEPPLCHLLFLASDRIKAQVGGLAREPIESVKAGIPRPSNAPVAAIHAFHGSISFKGPGNGRGYQVFAYPPHGPGEASSATGRSIPATRP
jgi:hypothetical protein